MSGEAEIGVCPRCGHELLNSSTPTGKVCFLCPSCGGVAVTLPVLRGSIDARSIAALTMALRRLILASFLAFAATGCDDAKRKAESIGIIGGEDGPTAVWLTTRLPWSNGEPIILRGTNGTRNCVFDNNGVAEPNTSKRPNQEPKWNKRR